MRDTVILQDSLSDPTLTTTTNTSNEATNGYATDRQVNGTNGPAVLQHSTMTNGPKQSNSDMRVF
jgi:hypothetical protein